MLAHLSIGRVGQSPAPGLGRATPGCNPSLNHSLAPMSLRASTTPARMERATSREAPPRVFSASAVSRAATPAPATAKPSPARLSGPMGQLPEPEGGWPSCVPIYTPVKGQPGLRLEGRLDVGRYLKSKQAGPAAAEFAACITDVNGIEEGSMVLRKYLQGPLKIQDFLTHAGYASPAKINPQNTILIANPVGAPDLKEGCKLFHYLTVLIEMAAKGPKSRPKPQASPPPAPAPAATAKAPAARATSLKPPAARAASSKPHAHAAKPKPVARAASPKPAAAAAAAAPAPKAPIARVSPKPQAAAPASTAAPAALKKVAPKATPVPTRAAAAAAAAPTKAVPKKGWPETLQVQTMPVAHAEGAAASAGSFVYKGLVKIGSAIRKDTSPKGAITHRWVGQSMKLVIDVVKVNAATGAESPVVDQPAGGYTLSQFAKLTGKKVVSSLDDVKVFPTSKSTRGITLRKYLEQYGVETGEDKKPAAASAAAAAKA